MPATGRWTGCSRSATPLEKAGVRARSRPSSDLEVDLLFFDTTSHLLRDGGGGRAGRPRQGRRPVPAAGRGEPRDGAAGQDGPETAGSGACGKSKDHRDDLPQIVIGMAVTRDGIPVRVWCWPGNTADSALIRQVKDDMRDWSLSRIVWVADRGFTSAENRRYLRKGGNHYIIGERLRSGSAEAEAALSRQGRYQEVAENLRVKEVRIARTSGSSSATTPRAPSATPRSAPG